jgi:hypothetical protein
MNFQQYKELFEQILNSPKPVAPYDDEHFLNYTKLNWSRMNRWLKNTSLTDDQKAKIASINEPQNWIVITEPWCGDAAHIVPFIYMIASTNPNINLDFVLRDGDNEMINSYLTNGSKSIPKLIIRNALGEDLAVWGPRPEKTRLFIEELKVKELSIDELKIELQTWYNNDKGHEILKELLSLISVPV